MNRLLYISIIVFALLLLAVNQGIGVIDLDENIRLWVQNLWGKSTNKLVIGITNFGAEISVFTSMAFVILFFVWKKQTNYVRFFLTGLFGSIFLFEVLKEIVGRERPESMLVVESQKSFPSGHATIATVLAWFFYFAFIAEMTSASKKAWLVLCVIYPIMMSFTRVYLNVHYLSDVIAGMALGTAWMIFLSKFYIQNETKIPTA